MPCCLLSLWLYVSITLVQGQDLSGYWQGIEHDTNSYSHPYPTSLTLTQNGTTLTGYYYQSEQGTDSLSVLFAIEKGQVVNEEGTFETSTPIWQKGPGLWCSGRFAFSYDPTRQRLVIRTTYREKGCDPSIIELYRAKLKAKQPFCPSDQKDLYVYGFDTRWYADAQRQVLLYRGNAYQPSLDTTTTFYITQSIVGVETPVVPLVINVDQITITNPATINALCATGKGQLVVNATGKSPLQYRLNGNAYQASSVFDLTKPGNYSLTIKDSLGCQASQRIELVNDCQEGLYLPTAFSPNGDGINDELIVTFPFRSVSVEEFSIFNRWGSLIYSGEKSKDIQSGQALWSAQSDGKSLLPDMYHYQLRVTTPSGKPLSLQGSLSVLK